jgi:hypothetical protein
MTMPLAGAARSDVADDQNMLRLAASVESPPAHPDQG